MIAYTYLYNLIQIVYYVRGMIKKCVAIRKNNELLSNCDRTSSVRISKIRILDAQLLRASLLSVNILKQF